MLPLALPFFNKNGMRSMAEDNEENSCLALQLERGGVGCCKHKKDVKNPELRRAVISAVAQALPVWISTATWQVQRPQNNSLASLSDTELTQKTQMPRKQPWRGFSLSLYEERSANRGHRFALCPPAFL